MAVPCAGETSPGTITPLIVLDPEGNEVHWLTRVLTHMGNEGTAIGTLSTYASSALRAFRVLWAIEANPATCSRVEWVVVEGWLNACVRRTQRRPDDAARPYKQGTVDLTASALKSIFDAAVDLEIMDVNPIEELRGKPVRAAGTVLYDSGFRQYGQHTTGRVGGPRRRSRKNPETEIQVLSAEAREVIRTTSRLRDRAMFTFCLDTGPRISEVLSLTPATYHPDANEPEADLVAKGRGGATRRVPVSDQTVEAIGLYLEALAAKGFRPGPDDQIFRDLYRPYGPATYNASYKALKRLLKDPRVHPHALRHTAATEMLDLLEGTGGRRLLTVQLMLGHINIATTRKYLHVETAEAIAAVAVARRSPRRKTQSLLHAIYKPEHVDLLNELRKEAHE